MEKLTAFDKEALAAIVWYLPCETPVQAAICCLAEMGRKVERVALNASFGRLCAAGFLRFERENVSVTDEVLFAARGRLWQKDGAWKEELFALLDGAEYDPASLSGEEYVKEKEFRTARSYAKKMQVMLRGGAQTPAQKIGWGIFAFVFTLLASVLFAVLAVRSAAAGDYDNSFAAVGSFIFLPCAIICGAACARAFFGKKTSAPEVAPVKHKGKKAVAALCIFSCLLHAAFFAVLIPFAWHHVFGLLFVLVVSALLAWVLTFFSRPSKAKPNKKKCVVKASFLTRNAQYFADGVDILSESNAASTSQKVYLNIFGTMKKGEIYFVRGKKYPFYVAIARSDGVCAVGFLRARDINYIYGVSPYRADDAKKNADQENEILRGYAEKSAKESDGDFLYSPDYLLRGFVCLQGEKYCVKISSPFFLLPDAPLEAPPEDSGISMIAPEPQEASVITWEQIAEECFEKKENADRYLDAVLAEMDSSAVYLEER